MVPLWCIVGLIFATVSVSTLGAAFSVVGVGALFSGAMIAVYAMAGSLEFAKFVLAAYLHQRWNRLNIIFKSYLVSAVVILSCITSMGIFGFLSDAYQSASNSIETENIKIANLKNQKAGQEAEIARINKSIEEIPASRISRRLQARSEAEPLISSMTKQIAAIENQIGESNLRLIEVKKKVGPLIYIARAFNVEIDSVVKYLILLFVTVFDPLAICLVIATSEALNSRKEGKNQITQPIETPNPKASQSSPSATTEISEGDEIIQMSFADDKDRNVV